MGSRNGVSTEKIETLHDYAKSPLYSEAEKVALEYADAITDTHRDVDDELFARVQVGSSRVDLQACKLEYSIVSPK